MDPDELGIALLVWLGVPALVLVPLTVALTAVAWYRGTLNAAAAISKAQRSAASFWARAPWVRCVALAMTASVTVASVFALGRFLVVFFASDSPLKNAAEFEWEELWIALLSYRDRTGIPIHATQVAAGIVVGLCVFAAFRARGAFELLAWVSAYVVVAVTAVFAVFWTVMFLVMAANIWAFRYPEYRSDHLVVYGTPAALCIFIVFALAYTIVFARQVFDLPPRGPKIPSHVSNYQYGHS